jgi:hypothetical protein
VRLFLLGTDGTKRTCVLQRRSDWERPEMMQAASLIAHSLRGPGYKPTPQKKPQEAFEKTFTRVKGKPPLLDFVAKQAAHHEGAHHEGAHHEGGMYALSGTCPDKAYAIEVSITLNPQSRQGLSRFQ